MKIHHRNARYGIPPKTIEMLELLRREGRRVPNINLIKTASQIEKIREAGRINSLVLDAVEKEIHMGMTTEEINEIVDRETRALGGIPAPLGFEGFPKSVCTSKNDVICHGIPSKDVVLQDGDIVNVDCTTNVGGYFGDASRMFCIGTVAVETRTLVEETKNSIHAVLKHLAPYTSTLGDIGYEISQYIKPFGYSIVRSIGGHGVGLSMHEEPYVCHVGMKGHGIALVPGMIFTIEPMINAGKEDYVVRGKKAWEVYTKDGSMSAQWEYMILMTETGYEILSK